MNLIEAANHFLGEDINNDDSYLEIEFVCFNSLYPKGTQREDQRILFNKLSDIDGVVPYMQDWSDDDQEQISLAVVIVDRSKESEIRKSIETISQQIGVDIDIVDRIPGNKVDAIVNGTLENQRLNINESSHLPKSMTSSEIRDLLVTKGRDAYGKMSYEDVKNMTFGTYYLTKVKVSELPQLKYVDVNYKNKSNFPPVLNFSKSENYYEVIDGRHRIGMAHKRGDEYIECYVSTEE